LLIVPWPEEELNGLDELVCPPLAGEGADLSVSGIGTRSVPLSPDDILHTIQPKPINRL